MRSVRFVAGACLAMSVLAVAQSCRSEAPVSAIATAFDQGEPIDWPLRLSPLPVVRQACRTDFCLAGAAVDLVLNRAAHWMAAYDKVLRFDAAIGLSQIRRIVDSPELERAWTAAVAVADADHDHPHRRFWRADLHSPPAHTSEWLAPASGERVNSNLVLSEALHCSENGWRSQTTAYVCGPMRDAGGYQSTHALWALALAQQSGCLEDAALACVRDVQKEVAQAQPAKLEPRKTLDIDLYAERLLVLLLSGYDGPQIHTWARTLIGVQDGAGSWGVAAEEEPYYRYHATNATTWALAEWLRLLALHRGQAAPLGAFRVQAPAPIGGAAFWGCALPPA